MKKIKILVELIKKLKVILPVKFKKKVPIIIICSVIAAVLETLGIAIIVPFMSTLLNMDELYTKWYIKPLVNVFHINDYYALLLYIGVAIVLVYVLKNIVLLIVRQYCNKFQVGTMSAVSEELLTNCIKRNYMFYLNTNSSEILTGIFKDSEVVYYIVMSLITILCEIITVVGIGAFIFATDWMMALGLVCIAFAVVVLIVFGFRRKNIKAGIQFRETYNQMYQDAIQAIGGIKEIKVSNRGKLFAQRFRKDREAYGDAQVQSNFINLCPERIVETVFISGIVLLLVFRVRWGANISESIVSVSALAMAGYRLLPSVNKLSTNFNSLIFYQPFLNAAYDNICKARMEEEERQLFIKQNYEEELKARIINFEKVLHLKNVSFGYTEDKLVLNQVSLDIQKGKAIAFVGETGTGKSTLIDIILGLLDPKSGVIEMDETDIHSIPSRWAEIIGYVPQSIYLLDASIRENVAFGLEDEHIDDEKIRECLRKAQLEKFLDTLPNGLNTVIGEQGVRLSGGQRQRIAIARALYQDPEILVLDEATSALDSETEKAVMEAIDMLHGEKTLIIVAHRLSTIAGCDEIYEVKDGAIHLKQKQESEKLH